MAHDKVSQEFGSLLFTDADMQERLPRPTYKKLRSVIQDGKPLDLDIANEVAHAMKEWALEKGATHFTHWFQPLTGITSEKHDSFMTPQGNGTILMSFSGKELVQGEPDASSFPSGGLRATFEARGYTVWDPASPTFIKDEVLCIPTAFISYTGEALDKRTPLLRSQVALEKQAKRVLALFGQEPSRVVTNIGPEQEYFLIKEEDFEQRPDLILCGRTLFGCEPSKGQELDEHYFGAIRPTVNNFMKELDDELWKLGIPAKTKHNEVAPCQHELAPVFEQGALAIDNNLLTMEKLKLLAPHHGLACLEHEKPFEYVNGSGKHDNWSLSADNENLLEPGDKPGENLRFLVFLACLVAAVDSHADLLRMSVASAGNDHRLGANEAPPAIVSVFLGAALSVIVDDLITGSDVHGAKRTRMDLGVPTLPAVLRDNTDRNRTSPFAFTGNKFEFRMCGSQQNLSDPNVILNTIVAEQCDRFANDLSNASEENFTKDIELFERYGVLSQAEAQARYVAKAEQYAKVLNIEARTMLYMTRHMYLPALFTYSSDVASSVAAKQAIGIKSAAETEIVEKLTAGIDEIYAATNSLDEINTTAHQMKDQPQEQCEYYCNEVLPAMARLRSAVDSMELICGHDWWPVPSYNKMLFYV